MLGDFVLARLKVHDGAGRDTLGYLAPECGTGGKASMDFGVLVAPEIACGKTPIDTVAAGPEEEEEAIVLVAWVWQLYGQASAAGRGRRE
ncbi:hypothetical protein Taro_014689 [Colocasia esculenta]|uniref:Uncharacterized protein n=1 Tax=Colocasia esculenta TaxID=4460 RepID=A0A843UJE6_COLES|nr:hypothetical protein [Colocasia esculenta]